MDNLGRINAIMREVENIALNIDAPEEEVKLALETAKASVETVLANLTQIRSDRAAKIAADAAAHTDHLPFVGEARERVLKFGDVVEANTRLAISQIGSEIEAAEESAKARLKLVEKALGSLLPPITGHLGLK